MKKLKLKVLILACMIMSAVVLVACGTQIRIEFVVDDTVHAAIDTEGQETVTMPADPVKEGYVFVGWFWDKDTWQMPFTANSLLYRPLTESLSVYAQLVKEEDYLEGLQANFTGFEKIGDSDSYSINVSNSTASFSFNNYVKVNNSTSRWTVSTDISGHNIIPTKTAMLNVGDNLFYVFVNAGGASGKLYTLSIKRNAMYTVSFDTNGAGELAPQNIEEGSLVQEPSAITKDGYIFLGWDYDFTVPVTQDEEIVAKWQENLSKITYELNGGTNNPDNPDSFDSATNVELLAPSKSGHSFEGWYFDNSFTARASVISAENTKVYARWIAGANVVFVGTNDNFTSIQTAIDASAAGSVIFVRAGEYTEEILINKSITLLGNNYGNTSGSRLPETAIYPTGRDKFNVVGSWLHIKIAADNVKVDGLMLDGDNPEISNLLTEGLKTLFPVGASGWYTYNKSGLKVGDELGVDGYAGIGISDFNRAPYNNVNIVNNIIKNYNHAGVLMESALKNVAGGITADSFGVNAVVSGNIISGIKGYGEIKEDGSSYGCYGRGVLLDGNMNVAVINNKISDCILGIMYTRIYARSDTPYTVRGNAITDVSVGIWLNSSGGISEAQTQNPGDKYVLDIVDNTISVTQNFKYAIPFFAAEEDIVTTYGILVTAVERTTISVQIRNNSITGVRYGVAAGNVPAYTMSVYGNTIENVEAGIALLNFAVGYSFFNYSNHVVAYNNTITDAEHKILIQPVAAAKVAAVYVPVDIINEEGQVIISVNADINKPISEMTIFKDGHFVTLLYSNPEDKFELLPALSVEGEVLRLYADWQEDTVASIDVFTPPTTKVYNSTVADINVNKGVIIVTYLSGRTENISMGSGVVLADGISISGFAEKTTGLNTITVTYQGQSATFEITVRYILTIDRNFTGSPAPVKQNYLYGDTIKLPTVTRSKFVFDGYYMDADCTIAFDDTTMPDGDLTIYCKWIPA